MKYKLDSGNVFTKDGHRMFYTDVLKDLNRKEYLEQQKVDKDTPNIQQLLLSKEAEIQIRNTVIVKLNIELLGLITKGESHG